MKKSLFIVSLLLIYSVTFSQLDKVAVVTINASKYIDASEFGTITAAMAVLSDDPKFDLTEIVAKFRNQLFDDFSKDFTFELIDEKIVTGNQDYGNYGVLTNTSITNFYHLMPEGYQYLVNDKKNKAKMSELFGDVAEGFMFAEIGYSLEKKIELAGFGIAYVRSWVMLRIFNKEGKKIFDLRVYAKSTGTFKFALGGAVLKAEEILPLCEEATDNAFIKMKKKLPKSIKKMDKKLKK